MEPEAYLIIPARNVEKTLENAVLSAHAQLKTNYQLFIVENGSVDNTYAVAQKLKSQFSEIPINILISNPGKIEALLTGLEHVKNGRMVFFMDSDVEATKKSFEPLYNQLLRHPQLIIACGYSVVPLDYNLAEPDSFLNLSSFFPLSKIVNDDTYGFNLALLDPQPGISPENEKKLKPFFHGRIFSIKDKRFIPQIIPKFNVADDVFWSRYILSNYGGGSIRTRYDARVFHTPRKSEEELILYRRRIDQQVEDITSEYPHFHQLEKAFRTHRDWSYICQLPPFVIQLFERERKIYSKINRVTERIAWHGDL